MGAYNCLDTAADIFASMSLWLTSLTRLSIFRLLHDKLKYLSIFRLPNMPENGSTYFTVDVILRERQINACQKK